MPVDRRVEGIVMQVVVEILPLFPRPNSEGPIDTQALFGETAIISEIDQDGWALGQLESDGYVGYLRQEGLQLPTQLSTPKRKVNVARTIVYPGPSMKLPTSRALSLGSIVSIAQEIGDFAEIPGLGFIWREHLAHMDHVETDFVAVAEKFVGSPYLWGGKTSCGLDCSGLVQIALRASGVNSPRDTNMMETSLGTLVDLQGDQSLQRGDIIFWKGHVGVLRDAETLLHASGHHMLVVSESLSSARARIFANTGADVSYVRRLTPNPFVTG